MNLFVFAFRLAAALLLGTVIGLERQWRQRTTGMRTNALVAVGAAMCVVMGGLVSADGGQGIRGLNSAATLWFTAAVGTLAALGQVELAAVGTAAVLASNLLLRPVAQGVSRVSNNRAGVGRASRGRKPGEPLVQASDGDDEAMGS
jgi:putative Mg2+ transporter-C (MgtC) family protein